MSRPNYAEPGPRIAVLVAGMPGGGKSTLAARLGTELHLPLFSKDIVKEAVADHLPPEFVTRHGAGRSSLGAGSTEALWALLAVSPPGGVVESWFWPDDTGHVDCGLRRAGYDPSLVPEVYCDIPMELARERFERRAVSGERHVVRGEQIGLPWWEEVGRIARPLALGPTIRVDTSAPVTDEQVLEIARQVMAYYP